MYSIDFIQLDSITSECIHNIILNISDKFPRNMETTHHSEQIQCQDTTANNDLETSQSSTNGCGDLNVRQMSPVLYTLNVFGIDLHRTFKYPCHKSGASNIAWSAYTTAVLLFLVANVCRLMGVYQQKYSAELQFIFNIQNTLWVAQNVGHYTVFYMKFVISSKFGAFLISYQEYADEYTGGIISIKRIAYKCVIVYWCILLLTFGIETYFIFDNDAYDAIVHWPLQNNNFKIVMQLIYTAFMLHISAMWLGITLIIIFFSICLVHEYQIINKEVLQLSHSNFLHRLEHFRRRHYKVGYLTRSFDQFISPHFAIDASCDFTTCCLLLYELIWDQLINDDIGYTLTYTVFIITTIAKVLVEFFCAGILNDAVSKCKIHFSH